MSRYAVDKLMRHVNVDPDALRAYVADPAGYVQKWEQSQVVVLSEAERAALATRDYGALYDLGAHPFLLWSFALAVWEHEVPKDELVAEYKARTAPLGYPDFAT